MGKAKRTGRPPRTDKPVRMTVRLPAEVRELLRVMAEEECIPEGDAIASLVLGRYIGEQGWHGQRIPPEGKRLIAMLKRLRQPHGRAREMEE